MKAFIVDDDPIVLTLVAFMLHEEGVDTRYALSPLPDNFYDILEDFQPDVLILDLYLKGEDGFSIAREVRRRPSLVDIPILAMSSSTVVEDKLRAFSTGFIEYLNKPFSRKEIVAAVKRYGYSSEILRLCDKIKNREVLDRELYFKFDK